MKKGFRFIGLAAVFCILLAIVAGCGGEKKAASDANKGIPKFLTVISFAPGGTIYPINVAHNSFVEKAAPGISIRLSPGGSTSNIKEVDGKKADIGVSHNAVAGMGRNGLPPYDKKYENVTHLLSGGPAGLAIFVRKDSKITSIEELKNKKIGYSPQGYLCNTIAEQLFEAHGFSNETIRKNGGTVGYYGQTEGPGMLADGHIDVYFCLGPWPYTPIMEVDFNPGIKLLDITDAQLTKLNEKYPYYTRFVVPKGTYKSQPDKDNLTIGSYWAFVANKDMTNEMAYAAVKSFWDNIAEIKKTAIDAHGANLNTALDNVSIPVHPGAQKYYDEKGIKGKK